MIGCSRFLTDELVAVVTIKKTIKGGEETCVKSFLAFYLAPLIKKTKCLSKIIPLKQMLCELKANPRFAQRFRKSFHISVMQDFTQEYLTITILRVYRFCFDLCEKGAYELAELRTRQKGLQNNCRPMLALLAGKSKAVTTKTTTRGKLVSCLLPRTLVKIQENFYLLDEIVFAKICLASSHYLLWLNDCKK